MQPDTPHLPNSRRAAWIAFFIPVLLLLPFIGKAFHLDDPYYVWTAKQIVETPHDFYGFSLNWTGTELPAWATNKNPPLVSYYMAVIGGLFGWGEIRMHIAFLLPAGMTALGTFYLARRFTTQPLLATAMAIVTPAFLVSATNVMAEVVMVSFYVWAIELWLRGLERDRLTLLFAAALLIVLSTLSKYFGVSIIPLLLVYTLVETRKIGLWLIPLALSIALVLAYELYTYILYGQALLFEAGSFATIHNDFEAAPRYEKLLTGLAFTGGCLAVAFFYIPFLWSRKVFAGAIALCAALVLIFVLFSGFMPEDARTEDAEVRWDFVLQFSLYTVVGLLILLMAVSDIRKHRDSQALLLVLWVFGTFAFAAQVNWTTNARALLPMAPPLAMLIVRRMDLRSPDSPSWRKWTPLIPTLLLSLSLCYADYRLANASRQAAYYVLNDLPPHTGRDWYVGHWGFQYYIDLGDALHVDVLGTEVNPGDALVIPKNNLNKLVIPDIYSHGIKFDFDVLPWLTTWNIANRAGFYSDTWGHLPFAFGRVPNEEYNALLISQTATLRREGLEEFGLRRDSK